MLGWPIEVEWRMHGHPMNSGSHGMNPFHVRAFVRASLVALTLAVSANCRAGDAADSGGLAGTSPAGQAPAAMPAPAQEAATPRAVRQSPARRLTVAQSIDASVRRLARGLDLDASQQATLRQILMDQHQQIARLRSGATVPGDVTGATLAIYDQTKARIRAMLNDDQKKKYIADIPRDGLAPAQSDLKHWMDLQEEKRREGRGDGESR